MTVITLSQFAQFVEEFPEMEQFFDINDDSTDEVDVDSYDYQQSLHN